MQTAPPPCDWYRAHEWDFDLWGAWAMTGNQGTNDVLDVERGPELPGVFNNIGNVTNDRMVNRDNTWAGGVDIKYFFSKYWALGVEGLDVNAKHNAAGGGFGTFTFRWPIGCSRFAPYGWAGFGAMKGGSHTIRVFTEPFEEHDIFTNKYEEDKHAEPTGQFGAGIECRITRHIGVMTDFAWNVVSGPDNNFGLLRFGATLSY